MHIINFTVSQDGKKLADIAVREQAVNGAKAIAKETGSPVSVIAHMDDGKDREVIFNPDGTNEKIWAIDRGTRFVPVVGDIYTNRGGGTYRCTGVGDNTADLVNTKTGWALTAHGVIKYLDGTIEWDFSTGGDWT